MGTALFAWELGGGLGHVGPMKVLAEHLIRWGHQSVFAVKDVISARAVLAGLGPVLQAPVMSNLGNAGQAFGAGSFTDILAIRGFGEPRLLGPAVDAWSDLFDLTRPDIVIADFSPTALVAAYSRIPVVTVGYGFYLPPNHLPRFPAFRDDVPPVLGENAVLASVQKVLAQRGRTPPKSLPALFHAQYTHVYSLPQLDPYAAFRRTPGFGPIETMPDSSPTPQEPLVFAYLAADHPQVSDAVVGLADLDCPVELCLQRAEPSLLRFATRRGLTVHERPPPLSEIIPRASLVVSHGGSGLAHAGLLGARPQLLLPTHAEAHGTTIMLEQLGAGRRFAADHGPGAIREAVKGALSDPALVTAAQAAANAARAGFHQRSRLEGLIEACNELISESRGLLVS